MDIIEYEEKRKLFKNCFIEAFKEIKEIAIRKEPINDFRKIYFKLFINETADAKYVTFSADEWDKISYSNKGQLNEKRTKTTLQRFIRRQLDITNKEICDSNLYFLCSFVISKRIKPEFFNVVSGYDIRDAYRSHFGMETCMTGYSTARYLDIYYNNPDKIQLLKFDDGNITARALIWCTDCDNKVLDKIYPRGDYKIDRVIQTWAKQNGIITKVDKQFYVTLKGDIDCYIPYIDTFRYFHKKDDNTYVFSNDIDINTEYVAMCTNGGFDHINIFKCSKCNKPCLHGRYYNMTFYCDNCFNELYFDCYICCMPRLKKYRSNINKECCTICQNRYGIGTCDVCGKKDITHMLYVFNDNKFICYDCYFKSSYKKCNHCDRVFSDTSNLLLKVRNDYCINIYICKECFDNPNNDYYEICQVQDYYDVYQDGVIINNNIT